MAKVNKLAGKETFAIRTQTAVCGVRGTVFVVRAREGGETTLAVKEGKVAVLPASVDIKKMKESLPEGQEDLKRNLEEFEVNAASVVESGKEVVIDMATLQKTEERLKQLEAAIQEISEEQDETIRTEKIDKILSEVETLSAEVAKTIPEAREISRENSKDLEKIEQSSFIDISIEPSGDEAAVLQVELGKIVLKTTPEDASILVNGVVVGRKQFSGIFPYGETVSFTIRREGYEEKTLIIEVSAETSLSYEVGLDPVEPAGPELRTVTVTATPDDARILLDQDVVGSGSFSGEFEVGTTLLFTVRKDGFTDEILNVEVDPDSDHAYSVVLGASYGGIRLQNTGVDGKYTVYIDGNRKGENLTTISRLAAGERLLSIKQKRMLGDIVIFSEAVMVPPGKDVTVSFAIPDLMEEEQAKLVEIETFVRDSFDSREAKDKVEEKLEEALSMLEEADLSEALKEEKDKFEQLRAEHKKKWIIW